MAQSATLLLICFLLNFIEAELSNDQENAFKQAVSDVNAEIDAFTADDPVAREIFQSVYKISADYLDTETRKTALTDFISRKSSIHGHRATIIQGYALVSLARKIQSHIWEQDIKNVMKKSVELIFSTEVRNGTREYQERKLICILKRCVGDTDPISEEEKEKAKMFVAYLLPFLRSSMKEYVVTEDEERFNLLEAIDFAVMKEVNETDRALKIGKLFSTRGNLRNLNQKFKVMVEAFLHTFEILKKGLDPSIEEKVLRQLGSLPFDPAFRELDKESRSEKVQELFLTKAELAEKPT